LLGAANGGWCAAPEITPVQLCEATFAIEMRKRTAEVTSPEALEELSRSIPLYMGPHCTKAVDSAPLKMFNKRTQNLDMFTLQSLLDMVEATAECAFAPENTPSQVERILSDPRSVWMEKHDPMERCVGIMGQTKTIRVPITITLRRMEPNRDCQLELLYHLSDIRERIRTNRPQMDDALYEKVTDAVITFLTFSFEESMSIVRDVIEEKNSIVNDALPLCTLAMIPCFKEGLFSQDNTFIMESDMSIACTCFVAVALLEYMASFVTPNTCTSDGGVPFRAHVLMQSFVPLVYALQKYGMKDENIKGIPSYEEKFFPNKEMVCWGPQLFDLTNLLDSSGFFSKLKNQQQMTQKHEKTQKEADAVLEQLWNGSGPLTAEGLEKILLSMQASRYSLCRLFQKAQPMRCQVRQLIDVFRKMCRRDTSIYNVVIMFFHTSILGGYPHARVRPSFVSLAFLYTQMFIEPPSPEDIFSWFNFDRSGQVCEMPPPPFDDWKFREWVGKESVPNSFSHSSSEAGSRTTGSTKKVKSEVSTYQRMFMYFLREAMRYYTRFVPALETVMCQGKKWEEMQKNMLVLLDMIRHTVDHGVKKRYSDAYANYKGTENTSFEQCLAQAGPSDPFLAVIQLLTTTRSHKYVVHIPPMSFEQTVCEAFDQIDNTRRSSIVALNFNYDGVPLDRLEAALSWGIITGVDPKTNQDIYTYTPDYLEYKNAAMQERLELLSVFLKTCTGPPTAPKMDTVLMVVGIDPLLVREFKEARLNHPLQSVLNSLKKTVSGLNMVTYTIVRFFFKYVVKTTTFNTSYMLPTDIIKRTADALRRKHNLAPNHPITPAMSTMMFCPSCEKMKGALANLNPRNVTGFGNGKVMVDPSTMRVYCAHKKRKQTTSVQSQTQKFLTMCFGEPSRGKRPRKHVIYINGTENDDAIVGSQEDDVSDQRKKRLKQLPKNMEKQLRSKLTSCSKAAGKAHQYERCQQTPQIAVPLHGIHMMYKGETYGLCMGCGSKMSITRSSFKGDAYTCGNCTSYKQKMDAVVCAYCFFCTLRDSLWVKQDVGMKGYKDKRTWGKYMVLDDTTIVNAEKGYAHIPAPRLQVLEEDSQTTRTSSVVEIYLCPKDNKTWIESESKSRTLTWSTVYTGLKNMYFERHLSSGVKVVMAPDERYKMARLLAKSNTR